MDASFINKKKDCCRSCELLGGHTFCKNVSCVVVMVTFVERGEVGVMACNLLNY